MTAKKIFVFFFFFSIYIYLHNFNAFPIQKERSGPIDRSKKWPFIMADARRVGTTVPLNVFQANEVFFRIRSYKCVLPWGLRNFLTKIRSPWLKILSSVRSQPSRYAPLHGTKSLRWILRYQNFIKITCHPRHARLTDPLHIIRPTCFFNQKLNSLVQDI